MNQTNEYSKSYLETMSKWYKHSFILAVFLMMSLLFLQGCGSSGFMLGSSKQQQYIPSEIPLYEIHKQLKTQSPPRSFSGKGTLLFSAPGHSERLSFEYYVNQDREVYELKSRIGIPVATIEIQGDSVLFLDRIELRAIRWHKHTPPLSAPGLIPPIRLYELLHYEDWIIQAEDVNQSTRDIRFTIPSFGYVYVELETYALSGLYYNSAYDPTTQKRLEEVWKLQVNDRKNYNNSPIARTFSIENETHKSQLFVKLVELQFNESVTPSPITIPSNYTQTR